MQSWIQYWVDFLKCAYDKTLKYPWRGRHGGNRGVGGKPFKVTSEGIACGHCRKVRGSGEAEKKRLKTDSSNLFFFFNILPQQHILEAEVAFFSLDCIALIHSAGRPKAANGSCQPTLFPALPRTQNSVCRCVGYGGHPAWVCVKSSAWSLRSAA